MARDIKTLENWLGEAAYKIRGPVDAPKYKDYILSLIFLKRLSVMFDEEIEKLANDYGERKTAEAFVEQVHSFVWFYLPKKARWAEIFKQSAGLREFTTDAVMAIARENPMLHGVIDIKDFNETAVRQRVISYESLKALIDVLNRHKLGLKIVDHGEGQAVCDPCFDSRGLIIKVYLRLKEKYGSSPKVRPQNFMVRK